METGAITPDEAMNTLRALLGRCTFENSTPMFRSAIEQAIGALQRNELTSAATIIGETCANVAGLHVCATHEDLWGPCLLQADEDEVNAYSVLGGLRFGFGFLYLDQMPNNVMVLRA